MSDLAILIQNLEADLGNMRRELSPADWERFKALLAQAAPLFSRAASDPDARLEAIYQLKHACLQFPATRRVIPAPGGAITPPPGPPVSAQPVSGLPEASTTQRGPDINELLKRAQDMCADPDATADRAERPDEGKAR